MKNVHVIPTDKPSRLAYDFNKLILNSKLLSPTLYKTQDIYITSDEEIKGVKWIIHNGKIHEVTENKGLYISVKDLRHIDIRADLCKKIVLTTDQDLISEGVQAIDDEFLEWFVKNPSCEWVGVKKVFDEDWSEISGAFEISYYKIIIPKEEPKQSVQEYEQQGLEKYAYELKETLEEAAEKQCEVEGWGIYEGLSEQSAIKNSFIAGAKWMQEQIKNESTADYIDRHIVQAMVETAKQKMYSDEEVRKISLDFFYHWWNSKGNNTEQGFDKWFEQNKKK